MALISMTLSDLWLIFQSHDNILRVLRAHGMDDVSLQTIFRSVVISKLMHASSAWGGGFAAASDRQRLAAFIRRSDRSRFVSAFSKPPNVRRLVPRRR